LSGNRVKHRINKRRPDKWALHTNLTKWGFNEIRNSMRIGKIKGLLAGRGGWNGMWNRKGSWKSEKNKRKRQETKRILTPLNDLLREKGLVVGDKTES